MKDRFLNIEESLERLKRDYNNYHNIIIAFDFDDTVFDYHRRGDTFDTVIELLQRAQEHGLSLICLSRVYDEEDIIFKSKYIQQVLNLKLDTEDKKINSSSEKYNEGHLNDMDPATLFDNYYNKPHYNIFLDDKAGLSEACQILEKFLDYLDEIKRNNHEL